MDQARARALLDQERSRLQLLLRAGSREQADDLSELSDLAGVGDEADDADRRNTEETDLAVDQLVRDRWAALQRAEARLDAGEYGRSVRSGRPIPDERLEADPLAELTLEEATAAEAGEFEAGDEAEALGSASHPYEVLDDPDITPEEQLSADEGEDEYDEPPQQGDPGIHEEHDTRR